MSLIFVDVEAYGLAPTAQCAQLTEWGAVDYGTWRLAIAAGLEGAELREVCTFHGVIFDLPREGRTAQPTQEQLALALEEGRVRDAYREFFRFDEWLAARTKKDRNIFVSDNPAYDFMWIACGFATTLGRNPFGHSARRISDFYAGLMGNFAATQRWKQWRRTPHTHHPVDDALGNVEAFFHMQQYEAPRDVRKADLLRDVYADPIIRPAIDRANEERPAFSYTERFREETR